MRVCRAAPHLHRQQAPVVAALRGPLCNFRRDRRRLLAGAWSSMSTGRRQMNVATINSLPRRMANFGQNLQMPVVAGIAYYLGAEAAFFVGTLSDKIFAP